MTVVQGLLRFLAKAIIWVAALLVATVIFGSALAIGGTAGLVAAVALVALASWYYFLR